MEITVNQIMDWGPCPDYTRERVIELFEGRPWVSPKDVLESSITHEDKLWVVLRPEILGEDNLHLCACDFAESVLYIYEREYPEDSRPRAAIESKRTWVKDKSEKNRAAMAASRVASWTASWAAEQKKQIGIILKYLQ